MSSSAPTTVGASSEVRDQARDLILFDVKPLGVSAIWRREAPDPLG
jgi:hypothetical protein